MIVCKFGGTSVADAVAIRRLVEIVGSRTPERPVVVVSALAGVTDGLLGLASAAYAGDLGALRSGLAALALRHETTARELAGGSAAVDPVLDDLRGCGTMLEASIGRLLLPAELDALGEIGRAHV